MLRVIESPPTLTPSVQSSAPVRTVADMRRELADMNANCAAADAAARQAKAIADKADRLLHEAADNVQRLKSNLEAAQRAATERRAKGITEALQAGVEPSATPAPPEADTAPLSAAVAHLRAVEEAALTVEQERDKTAAAAAAAATARHTLVDAILDAEWHMLADERRATAQLAWGQDDLLDGLAALDDKRAGGPRLHQQQWDLVRDIDRRKHEQARDVRLIEMHYWQTFLKERVAAAEKVWLDYRQRLLQDASAPLHDRKGSSQ